MFYVVNKDVLLSDYNKIKEKIYIEDQNQKYKKHMCEFQEKYAKDEYMWEFDTLSMFLTNDPLKDAKKTKNAYLSYSEKVQNRFMKQASISTPWIIHLFALAHAAIAILSRIKLRITTAINIA